MSRLLRLRRCVSLSIVVGLSACISTEGMTPVDTKGLTIINWLLRAPLILVAVIFGGLFLIWLGSKAGTASRSSRMNKQDAQRQNAWDTAQRRFQEERDGQFATLKAALPTTPPERMRATIHVNTIRTVTLLPPHPGTRDVEVAELFRYAVDMILELPERDRALIKGEDLEEVKIEQIAAYSEDQIFKIYAERELMERRLTGTGRMEDHVALATMKALPECSLESYQTEKRDVTLGEYLRVPYSQIFNTKPEANDYADRLRTLILPSVRTMLEKVESRSSMSGTIEF